MKSSLFSWFQRAWNISGHPTIVEDAGTRYELPRARFLELHEPEDVVVVSPHDTLPKRGLWTIEVARQ